MEKVDEIQSIYTFHKKGCGGILEKDYISFYLVNCLYYKQFYEKLGNQL